jgi:hypothetical protein
MKNRASIFTILAISAFLFTSCKKDKSGQTDSTNSGKLSIEFDNRFGASDLMLNNQTYTNALGQSLNVSIFQYYISNIVLHNSNGSKYVVPQNQSYFFVSEKNAASQKIVLSNIPEGDYNAVSFLIGIDSIRNTLPISERTGVLDPTDNSIDMYWQWNSGYIFVKMEGQYDSASIQKPYKYHIGGFGGYSAPTINNIKEVTLPFGATLASVRKDLATGPVVHLFADASKVISGTTDVDLFANPLVMFSPYSVNIANNYAGMFSVNQIHNE